MGGSATPLALCELILRGTPQTLELPAWLIGFIRERRTLRLGIAPQGAEWILEEES